MKKEIQQNLPYTIIGHTSIPNPHLSILLTAEGIKELSKRMKKDDVVKIEEWSDVSKECNKKTHWERITIIKH